MKNKYKGLTPHNDAQLGEIAKIVLMPGDPLRAKFIAEKYLKDYKEVNNVRGMLAFTGTYKGVPITVMGSGMGIPSMGIYSKELFKFYEVENIIRVGSTATIKKEIKMLDILVAEKVVTKSTYYEAMTGVPQYTFSGNQMLIDEVKKSTTKLGLKNKVHYGTISSGDAFDGYINTSVQAQYMNDLNAKKVIGLEMESTALYANAKIEGKKALTILSVCDHILTGEVISAQERQNSFTSMIELALDVATNL